MNIYYDLEFTGLHKNTTIISIGLEDENGKTFYAESTEYDKSQINPWLQTNVIDNLLFNDYSPSNNDMYLTKNYKNKEFFIKGSNRHIRRELLKWLSNYDEVQFVSDVCHYDFVLLIDLLADSALDLPEHISPYCHDINQDIANKLSISDKIAFNQNREELLRDFGIIVPNTNKHNSLHDAKVIKQIYDLLHK